MNVFIIGTGLIGGSLALDIKEKFENALIFGIDSDELHLKKALQLNLIDYAAELSNVSIADVVIVSLPVDATVNILGQVLDKIPDKAIVFDVGSTKQHICESVANHPKRGNYIATHPIAGTEFSGPTAATPGLFNNKTNILCETDKTNSVILDRAKRIFTQLEMNLIYMDPITHDKHIAYCSHLSHICSFMLGKTVINKQNNEKGILDLAGSGFASTVRLAKSSPSMWTPIFKQNKENVIEALDEFILNLFHFRNTLISGSKEELYNEMKSVNRIKDILKEIDHKQSAKALTKN